MDNRLVAMRFLQLWLITQVLLQTVYGQARSVVIGKKFLCVGANPQYVVNTTCKIRLINRSNQLYNMNIELQPNVTLYNMHVKIAISIKYSRNYLINLFCIQVNIQTYYKFRIIYRPILLKLHRDLCETIKSKDLVIDAKNNNLDAGCPFKVFHYHHIFVDY